VFTITIDWSTIILASLPFFSVLILKLLLDLRLAHQIVKYLYWLPVRNYFRERPLQLAGEWEYIWEAGGSSDFTHSKDRHGHSPLRQLGVYCYSEFFSKGIKYGLFGEVNGGYLVGEWFDLNDPAGYFGVFQLEIVSSSELSGIWLGHSKHERTIRNDHFHWKKVGQ
jgi:hypothetical protein